MNYQVIKIDDERYPEKLRKIANPPKHLYCVGNVALLNNESIAIVGCRNASPYGYKIAKIFADGISKEGVTIISGLARGIDAEAHKNSINNIGKTIAVLGCGLDIIYPEENESLYKDIIEKGGLIITEFGFGTKPLKENFPQRNRIVSGLSDGVIVVEAKRRSGTMITVDYALEQGKNVFVVPGNIDSINSSGTNELIKQGATPITNYKEVFVNSDIM